MSLKLIKLDETYKRELGQMIDEWTYDQKVNKTNHSPWSIFKNDYKDFNHYLNNLEVLNPENERVPDSVFFLLDTKRSRLLGGVNIRHYLNDSLTKVGGHIGLGIRPSERNKGFATQLIALSLIECKKLGIKHVLITCDKENIGSAKAIISNGGVLDNEVMNEKSKIVQRYWINLS